jgi:hypothetical protein
MAENPHYKELLQLLNEFEVEYLIVGGFAVMKYSEPRHTKDLDVWVRNSRQNSLRVVEALKKFGAPVEHDKVTAETFADKQVVYQIGIAPVRVDILAEITGVRFPEAWRKMVGVVREEYAVSADGMKMFGVMDLSSGFEGCRFAIGLRNSHDKSFRLSCTVGLRVFVCENLAFHGEYTPVLAKHSKHFSLEDSLAIGVDRMQRNFGPLKQQVETWQSQQLSTGAAKLLIYQAFIEEESGFPKHLARRVHDLYFQPVHEEFQARTMWSLSNAFTSAFKDLDPIPQYKATAKLAGFLQPVRPS